MKIFKKISDRSWVNKVKSDEENVSNFFKCHRPSSSPSSGVNSMLIFINKRERPSQSWEATATVNSRVNCDDDEEELNNFHFFTLLFFVLRVEYFSFSLSDDELNKPTKMRKIDAKHVRSDV